MALISWAFMPRGSALRSYALAFPILLLTKKGPPSYYLLLTNDRPVHMTIVELCIPCNCNKCTFLSLKMHLLALLGLLTDRNDSFPYPFIVFN